MVDDQKVINFQFNTLFYVLDQFSKRLEEVLVEYFATALLSRTDVMEKVTDEDLTRDTSTIALCPTKQRNVLDIFTSDETDGNMERYLKQI